MTETLITTRSTPFDPPSEVLDDPRPLRRFRFPDGHLGWLVTSFELGRAVLGDDRFSAAHRRQPVVQVGAHPADAPPPPGVFLHMDAPEHTRLRRLLSGQFTVRRMRQVEPRVEQMVTDHLDAMEQAGPPVDLVDAFALPIPSLVICELLGVPYGDHERFQHATKVLFTLDSSKEDAEAARASLGGYLREHVRRRTAEPGQDLLSDLAAGGELSEEELIGISQLLLIAGHETTANMLALGTFALLSNPEQAEAVREGRVDAAQAVEELLRYLTIVQFPLVRTAREDIELGGEVIRAGEAVGVHMPAANRDPARFTEGHKLDVGSQEARGHLAFGYGAHQCLGQQFARMEMRLAYPALLRRFPGLRLAVAPEEVPLRTDMSVYGVHRLMVEW
ncbi:cytochrome P450 [Streptomyces muensis]|uniref:Cytochrome P450 n=1 Tax=Streptomyces muensis TaxID=1077944 RepID=A0A9X1TIT5_STRM4|nr:cytochrome P450 [Streptomyces muensis]MCF1592602.1 cytochrome P450 [Streptomyces muensis]